MSVRLPKHKKLGLRFRAILIEGGAGEAGVDWARV